ncbi:YdcF family protein [Allokutzneria multivorans]|uniref:YdcF family protein n=1 Tax=Allokutzneria multivorans TaxID=1142134 RepID=A0ABP7TSE7_9PSEU
MPAPHATTITDQQWYDAELVWSYHQLGHEQRACDVAIGLGSHDLGVANAAVSFYEAGSFPLVVFSGGNSATTRARFPRGEAVHYREHALAHGVPPEAILVEPHASNTGQNITYSREVLAQNGIAPTTVMLISKPYMQRRAYATTRKLWPEIEVVCASEPMTLKDYVSAIGDPRLVVDMLIGDLQRIQVYPSEGFAIAQDVPAEVAAAYDRLVREGFTSRLLST